MSVLQSALVLHLQADAAITAHVGQRVYPARIPPKKAAYPLLLVYALTGPTPERAYGPEIAFEEAVYLVKVIDEDTSPKTASEILAAVRASLDDAALTIAGYTCQACLWQGDLPAYDTFEDGRYYQHHGGQYYLMAEANS